MKVKELITKLLDEPMNADVRLYIEEEHVEGDVVCGGYLFDIDAVEHGTVSCRIRFTDWRTEANP